MFLSACNFYNSRNFNTFSQYTVKSRRHFSEVINPITAVIEHVNRSEQKGRQLVITTITCYKIANITNK